MLHPAISVTLLAALSPALAPVDLAPDSAGTVYAQVTIHERVIIKVPRMNAARLARQAPAPLPVRYDEKRGPKCIAATDLGGALIAEPGAVDLMMAGGKRLRARLDADCGPMDFYAGFYLRPAADGRVCAGRDVIRIRSGAGCTITRFRTLVPAR